MRTILSIIIATSALGTMAQNSNVVNAYNYMKDGDYAKAAEYIDPAITNETTSRAVTASENTVHATAAPTNGAVANTSCPRAAPRSRAPATHSVIETP